MGLVKINNAELSVKEYEGQRVLTLWDIARLHGVTPNNIRTNFENNKKYLLENEDYFVVNKQNALANNLIGNKEMDHHALNAVKNIPIFTESGYLMMVKPMKGELAWAVQRELVKSYFKLQEVKQVIKKQLDANTALETSKFLVDLATAAGISPESKLLLTKTIYKEAGIDLPFEISTDEKYYDSAQIAKEVGVYSNTGKPHQQAINAILNSISIPSSDKKSVWEGKGNWQGTVIKYTYSVITMVKKWLEDNKYPSLITSNSRKFKVSYHE